MNTRVAIPKYWPKIISLEWYLGCEKKIFNTKISSILVAINAETPIPTTAIKSILDRKYMYDII
jgi:hypothetical protein